MRVQTLLILSLALAASGCSTVTGWFSASPAAPKPAELVEFKPTLTLAEAWKTETAETGNHFPRPFLRDESVFAAGGNRVTRTGVLNGSNAWRTELPFRVVAGPGVGEGGVIVGGARGELAALDAATGQIRWQVTLSSEVVGVPQISGEIVAVLTGDGRVHGLALADGARRWLYTRTLPALTLRGAGGLFVLEDRLYAGFPGGRLVALNPANGAQLWEATVALPRGSSELERVTDVMGAPVADSRQVCAVTSQGRVACFDPATGTPQWARETSSHTGLAMDSRLILVTDDKDAITAYDRMSGRAIWRQDKLARRTVSAPLSLGAVVIVGDGEGFVHVLAADDGRFLARTKVDAAVRVAPLDIGPGFAVQTARGSVIAFRIN